MFPFIPLLFPSPPPLFFFVFLKGVCSNIADGTAMMVICQLFAALTLFAAMLTLSVLYPLYKDKRKVSAELVQGQLFIIIFELLFVLFSIVTACYYICFLFPLFQSLTLSMIALTQDIPTVCA